MLEKILRKAGKLVIILIYIYISPKKKGLQKIYFVQQKKRYSKKLWVLLRSMIGVLFVRIHYRAQIDDTNGHTSSSVLLRSTKSLLRKINSNVRSLL
jgi:hypothetical protein